MKNTYMFVITTAAFLAAITGCANNEAAPAATKGNNAPVIKTARVDLSEVSDQLSLPARVQADPANVVRVYPPASGRLLRVEVRPGDRVSKGQPLALLESSDVAQARSDYSKAQAEFEKDQRAQDRSKLLFDHKVLSEREFEEQQSATTQAKSELDRATDRLRILGLPLKGTSNQITLVAPRSGSVLDLGAAGGELSKSVDNANPICTIADLGTVWIVGDMYERDLGSVRPGDPVDISVNAYPDRKWAGKLALISDTVDPQTRTLKVRVVLKNPDRQLKPEMFASIHIRKPAAKALVVPSSAVLHEGGDTSVMVETKPGTYERRLVNVQSATPKDVVIASGLKPGETVVTQGAALLRGGGDDQ
jgi:cobalt-zinc-cadmium efflux system membrane fusion protein